MKHFLSVLVISIFLISCSSKDEPGNSDSTIAYPSEVNYTKVENSSLKVTWKNNSSKETGFTIWARLASDTSTKIKLGSISAGVTEATVATSTLTEGINYYIGVQALGANENLDSKITYATSIYKHTVTTPTVDPDANRKEIPSFTDMVLIYGGGHHRPYSWGENTIKYYVSYADKEGKKHWLFDSFLFIEFMDPGTGGSNKAFATGYTYDGANLESATQVEWQQLIDYFFTQNVAIDALDKAIEKESATLGAPTEKRKIVITIPEPIVKKEWWNPYGSTSTYWGKVDGKTLDFNNDGDRVIACKWYIDKVRETFYKQNYKNVELAGFYWLAEKATQTSSILSTIAQYLDGLKYSFNWIPYYTADGYSKWKDFGFHQAFYQPNYFFSDKTPDSRLDVACQDAQKYDMNMELEFDDKVLISSGYGYAYRLRNYMNAYKKYDVWKSRKMAYYQGGTAVRNLALSTNAEDQALYHEFCQFVISRPIRSTH